MSIKKLALTHNGRLCQQQQQPPQQQLILAQDDRQISGISLLDLPELVLDCIFEKLPPQQLCTMAGVCTSLRERCTSDHLWEKQMNKKWGKIIGPAASREWQLHVAARNGHCSFKQAKQNGILMKILSIVWPFCWLKSRESYDGKKKTCLRVDSIMAGYLALESGSFTFPAQVYNRENGHVGFILSCYDAQVSYDPRRDTFQARYPPHGSRAITLENGIPWERLRSSPGETSPHELQTSDCLNDLRPADHFEIQWRRNKQFPYGWWYGVVGHLESCDGNENYCRCHESDTIVLEFHQYTRGSRWRCTRINRKEHREEGNEADGFYGGIRKLYSKQEISRWEQLWPTQVLE